MRFLAFDTILASVNRTLVQTVAKWMRCLTFLIQRQPSRRFAFLLYWNRTAAWVLSCKLGAYFKNTFSEEHPWTAASVYNFRLSVKFSTHMMNSTREKFWFSWLSITLIFDCSLTSVKNAFSKVLQKSCLSKLACLQLHDITFCRVINCSWETCEFNKCTISLKMQQLRITGFNFHVIPFVLANLIN